MPMLGILALTACAPHSSAPNGSVALDEEVTLVRAGTDDQATREVTVDSDATLVAIVDENLTDVRVKLAAGGQAIEVENQLDGVGVEVATLSVPRGSRVVVTLTGRQNFAKPGTVHLWLRKFPGRTAMLDGYQAWAAATDAALDADDIKPKALPALDRAIKKFSAAQGDPKFAALARLQKARALLLVDDLRQARTEAQQVAVNFEALQPAEKLLAARARLVEARALTAIALDSSAVDPTSDQAARAACELLGALAGANSAFGPIERAHALRELGSMDVGAAKIVDANQRFEAARVLYEGAGYIEGERVVRVDQARTLVEQGRFGEGAKAFKELLPEVERISDADSRVTVMLGAGRALMFVGKSDEGVELLLRARDEARVHGLRQLEASALENVSFNYWDRGDRLQAMGLNAQALKILRNAHDSTRLAYALESGGSMARNTGDFAKAIEMHKEAVSLAIQPVPRVRALRSLGVDYVVSGNYVEGEKQLRAALAVKLEDPRHNVYNDVKRNLAELFIEHGDGSRAQLDEAAALLRDSLERTAASGESISLIGTHRAIAALLAREGSTAAALAEYDRTFQLIFDYRRMSTNTSVSPVAISFEQPAFRGYFDVVMQDLVAHGGGKPRPASALETRALRMLELARASHFGAVGAARMDAATTARTDALLTQMGGKSLRIATLLKGETTPEESRELEALQSEMSNLRTELDRARTAAAQKGSAAEKTSLDSKRPWRTVGKHSAQLSYAFGNEHGYVWARSGSGMLVAVLSEPPEAIEGTLADLAKLDAQLTPAQIEQTLEHLSSVLLPPGMLAADTNALEIVAEGRMASVPFAGLRSPADHARRLVETHGITMISSLYASNTPQRAPQARPFRLVALASGSGTLRSAPVTDQAPRLQAAVDEIQAIGGLFEASDPAARVKLLTGDAGSAPALRGIWSSGADVVHFATHALADLRQPLASLLVLPATDARGAATYLTAGQVQDWRGDAQLVFLSTCESAIGPPRFASGMPGLQSAFLRAGAQGVIATLWPIEDVLARQFSADFYGRFTAGQTAADALRDTQRAWLTPRPGAGEDEMLRRRITAMAHGFYTR
jgi:tetratricopeptide (TPR) repeat protein